MTSSSALAFSNIKRTVFSLPGSIIAFLRYSPETLALSVFGIEISSNPQLFSDIDLRFFGILMLFKEGAKLIDTSISASVLEIPVNCSHFCTRRFSTLFFRSIDVKLEQLVTFNVLTSLFPKKSIFEKPQLEKNRVEMSDPEGSVTALPFRFSKLYKDILSIEQSSHPVNVIDSALLPES